MSTLTIRNIEPAMKDKRRMAAAAHGQSMEEDVRTVLTEVAQPAGLGSRIHARFAALGGLDLDLPASVDVPRAASLDRSERKF